MYLLNLSIALSLMILSFPLQILYTMVNYGIRECINDPLILIEEYNRLITCNKYRNKFYSTPINYDVLVKKNIDDIDFINFLKDIDLFYLNAYIHYFVKENFFLLKYFRKHRIPEYISY